MVLFCYLFFSSRRRHTRCALVTGVQTCALPILFIDVYHFTPVQFSWLFGCNAAALIVAAQLNARVLRTVSAPVVLRRALTTSAVASVQIGRASCRERVCPYV